MRVGRAAFTLVELLMVALVVGILASVAIPTYGGQKRSAQDAEAFQRLEIALRHGASQFTLNELFPAQADLVAGLAAAEPHLGVQEGSGWPVGAVTVEATALRADYRAASRSGGRVAIRDERDPAEGGPKTIRWRATPEDVAGGPVINELPNPSAESGVLTPWAGACGTSTACDPPALTDVTEGHGRWALTRRATGGATQDQSYAVWRNGVYTKDDAIAVSAGDILFLRARARVTEGTCRLHYALARWGPDGSQRNIAYLQGAIHDGPPVGRWVTLADTYTVPEDVGYVGVRIGCNNIPDGVTVTLQIDRAMLVKNPPAVNPRPSYMDGDSPGGTWLAGGKATGRSHGVPIEPLPPA